MCRQTTESAKICRTKIFSAGDGRAENPTSSRRHGHASNTTNYISFLFQLRENPLRVTLVQLQQLFYQLYWQSDLYVSSFGTCDVAISPKVMSCTTKTCQVHHQRKTLIYNRTILKEKLWKHEVSDTPLVEKKNQIFLLRYFLYNL